LTSSLSTKSESCAASNKKNVRQYFSHRGKFTSYWRNWCLQEQMAKLGGNYHGLHLVTDSFSVTILFAHQQLNSQQQYWNSSRLFTKDTILCISYLPMPPQQSDRWIMPKTTTMGRIATFRLAKKNQIDMLNPFMIRWGIRQAHPLAEVGWSRILLSSTCLLLPVIISRASLKNTIKRQETCLLIIRYALYLEFWQPVRNSRLFASILIRWWTHIMNGSMTVRTS